MNQDFGDRFRRAIAFFFEVVSRSSKKIPMVLLESNSVSRTQALRLQIQLR
ncbi:MAG: hypothetical protein AAF915_01750 [Cyanobacteria bacterium P01_D01_bin.50]